jgi:hypothetical protein
MADVDWYRIPTNCITDDDFLLEFNYYGRNVKIIIAKYWDLHLKVSFDQISLFYLETEPYTSLWVCDQTEFDKYDKLPSNVHEMSHEKRVSYEYIKEIKMDGEFIYVGFYISL